MIHEAQEREAHKRFLYGRYSHYIHEMLVAQREGDIDMANTYYDLSQTALWDWRDKH